MVTMIVLLSLGGVLLLLAAGLAFATSFTHPYSNGSCVCGLCSFFVGVAGAIVIACGLVTLATLEANGWKLPPACCKPAEKCDKGGCCEKAE